MEITSNTTRLRSGLCVQTDKYGRDHCVVVLVGTFRADAGGELELAPSQRPPTTAVIHHGDPAMSSVEYEADFALRKPLTDVIVVGKAVAPGTPWVLCRSAEAGREGRTFWSREGCPRGEWC